MTQFSTANTDPKTGISYHDLINNRWGKGQGNSEKSSMHSKSVIMFKDLFPLSYKLSVKDSTDEEINPCRPIDGLDLEAWEVIMNTGQGATERENHIYHWMSWANTITIAMKHWSPPNWLGHRDWGA